MCLNYQNDTGDNMKNKRERLDPQFRKRQIFETALRLAEQEGYHKISRPAIAKAANVSTNLVTYYFKSVTKLQNELMRMAIERQIISIVADGIYLRHDSALNAPTPLKQKALDYLAR